MLLKHKIVLNLKKKLHHFKWKTMNVVDTVYVKLETYFVCNFCWNTLVPSKDKQSA